MRNADTILRSRAAVSVFCILQAAVLSCANRPPAVSQAIPPPRFDAVAQLHQDILSATNGPGVSRGVWGIAVYSLDRQQPLFDLNPRAMLVPASSAKIVTVATAA